MKTILILHVAYERGTKRVVIVEKVTDGSNNDLHVEISEHRTISDAGEEAAHLIDEILCDDERVHIDFVPAYSIECEIGKQTRRFTALAPGEQDQFWMSFAAVLKK